MKRRKTNSEYYMVEALFLLMKAKPYTEITIKEITEKAGVNRSTFYRNFNQKEELIIYFYTSILDQCSSIGTISLEEHLTNVFEQFKMNQAHLLLLHQNHLSYILLECLTAYFSMYKKLDQFDDAFQLYYHTGGIFNTLYLWFEYEMKISIKQLVLRSMDILPPHFEPWLKQNS